jgi:hypothetical protein
MLHLFNKVYLEFDDRDRNHFDRVVISQNMVIKCMIFWIKFSWKVNTIW